MVAFSGRLIGHLIIRRLSRCGNFGARALSTSYALSARVNFKLSDIGEGIREVAVKEWYVKEGDAVHQFDKICEVQSDKASVTITSRYDGIITKLFHKVDDTALVGQPLLEIDTNTASESKEEQHDVAQQREALKVPPCLENGVLDETTTKKFKRELCIPSVRRLAKQYNVDLSRVNATGKDGRILKEDVLQYINERDAGASVRTTEMDRTEAIKGFQRTMVKTMTEALKIPTFVYSDEMSVTKLSQVRRDVSDAFSQKGVKISFVPFFVKAISNALIEYPKLNAVVDANCEHVTYKAAHNIGIAMDTKAGLAVPVIKNCQQLTIAEIAVELNRIMSAGKQGSFSAADLNDGTFTLSNIGAIGGTYTKPIILPPQVAILAIGGAKLLPRFDKNLQVIAEEIVCLSGSADHRIIDGATMARFVNHFKRQIEDPTLLFLNL